jgi:hypothetical protein
MKNVCYLQGVKNRDLNKKIKKIDFLDLNRISLI